MFGSRLGEYRNIVVDAIVPTETGVVVFESTSIATSETGALCPIGAQSIQTEQGWVYLRWEENCTEGAQAIFNGSTLGEICLDFSDWLGWENSPFE